MIQSVRVQPQDMGGRSSGRPILPHAIMGTTVFVITEVMFFAALVSAFLVIKAGSVGEFAPPVDITLPVATTALNSVVLLMSGVALWMAGRQLSGAASPKRALFWLNQSWILGAVFVAIQGREWMELIRFGMTLKSDVFGACFYLLIGSHAIHAFSAVLVMAWCSWKWRHGGIASESVTALQIFWYFIVAVWPILYGLIYF